MEIGFIGLGRMGQAMARRLVAAGNAVRVYTRNPNKLQHFAQSVGCSAAKDVAELARGCSILFTMLADDRAVEQVFSALKEEMVQGKRTVTWVEMSTISPQLSRSLAHEMAGLGNVYLDAPVSGSVDAAESGQLVFMVGSRELPSNEVNRLLLTMGRAVYPLGEVGCGHSAKLLINSVLHSENQIVAEILTLSHSLGLDQVSLLDLLLDSAAASPMMKFRRPLFAGESNDIPFALALAAKDMRLSCQLADQCGLQLPQLQLNSQQLRQAVEAGYGERDMAAMTHYMKQVNQKEEA